MNARRPPLTFSLAALSGDTSLSMTRLSEMMALVVLVDAAAVSF